MLSLTHAAWCLVLSGEHLSGKASRHQALGFPKNEVTWPCQSFLEHWASSNPGKARGQFHQPKLGNTRLALPSGSLRTRHRIKAGHSGVTRAKHALYQPDLGSHPIAPPLPQGTQNDSRQEATSLKSHLKPREPDATLCMVQGKNTEGSHVGSQQACRQWGGEATKLLKPRSATRAPLQRSWTNEAPPEPASSYSSHLDCHRLTSARGQHGHLS